MRRSATMPCADSSSAPIVRLRGIWRACSKRPSGAASGARAAIRRRASWRRSCRRPHERDCALPERLVSWGAETDGDRDGLLVRVRASGGRLTLDQAVAIADGALACGNGAISLSARGNLQVRGVSEKTLPDLHARLAAADLLDTDPEVERLRNIVVSPLSDIDPDAAFDFAPHLAALEREPRQGRRFAPAALEVQLHSRRGRAAAGRRYRRGHPLRGRARRERSSLCSLSSRRRRTRSDRLGERDRRGGVPARRGVSVPRRRRRGAADARPCRAPRRKGRVRKSWARSQGPPAAAPLGRAARRARRSRFRFRDRRRRAAPFGDIDAAGSGL